MEAESDVVSNEDSGGEEESKRASGSSGAGQTSKPTRQTTGRKHGRGGVGCISKHLNIKRDRF